MPAVWGRVASRGGACRPLVLLLIANRLFLGGGYQVPGKGASK